jgi:iron complex outermembrane receptor protein
MNSFKTIHRLLLCCLAMPCLFPTILFAYTTDEANSFLSGKIIDARTGKPLQGAVIYLHEAKTGTVSDSAGAYKTPVVPAGKYLVEISFEGYTAILEMIEISNNPVRNFSLKETFAENDAVTVTGVASATKTKQSAQPVSILKRNDLLQTSATNVIDAIARTVPGISSLSSGPAVSKPVIRGLGYNRVVTVHDGVRQEGQQWGDEHGIEVDEYSIQKIEILKGPASLLYGSDAMAGVVHLITNVPVEQGTVKGNVTGSFIDNSGLRAGSANIAGHLQSGFNWNVYGTAKSAGDYRNKFDGKVFNSRFNEKDFGGYLGLNKSWGYSHLLISSFNQTVGVIEGDRDPVSGRFLVYPGTADEHAVTDAELDSRTPLTPKQHITHFKIASDNNFSLGKNRLALNIGYQRNQRREMGDPGQSNIPDLHFDLQTVNYSIQYNLADKDGWKTSMGVTGMYQQNRNLAEEVLIPEYNQFDIGAFGYTRKTFHENFTVSGGLRFDHRNVNSMAFMDGGVTKFNAFTRSFSNISGSLGLSYNPSDAVTLKFNIARGYRAPSVSELASNGAHEGTDRYEYGDQALQSETSLQLDGGLEVNSPHVSLVLNTFYNRINNYIFYGKLESVFGGDSLVNLGGSDLQAYKFRQSGATLAGFEIKLDLHPHPLDWLHFENSLALVYGKFDNAIDGSDNLPFMPPPRWQSELRGNFNKAGHGLRNLYVKIEMDNIFTQNKIFAGYNTETPTQGYTVFNLGIGSDITSKGKTILGIHAGLNNLFDVAYQDHLSRLKYTDINNATGRVGVFNMGRSFSLKVNVPLGWKMK